MDISFVRPDGVWELLDLSVDPEREALFLVGRFEEARSGNGESGPIDAPLLLYRPDRTPQALFIPAASTTAEEDEAARTRLAEMLVARLREADRLPSSLSLAVVMRPFLPLFIAEDEAVRAIAPALQLLLSAPDSERATQIVAETPALLSDAALRGLDRLKAAPPDEVDREQWSAFLGMHRNALTQMREAMAPSGSEGALLLAAEAAQTALSRYEASQALHDLEAAVAAGRALLAHEDLRQAPPLLAAGINQLAAGILLARFVRLGEADDLADARRLLEEAATHVSGDPAARGGLLDSLAIGLAKRFGVTGDPGLLDEALALSREAVALTPDGHPQKPGMLNNLATFLSERFGRLGEIGDLEAAIARAREAVKQLRALIFVESDLSELSAQANTATRLLVGLLWQAKRWAEIAPEIEAGRGFRLKADLLRADSVPAGLSPEEAGRYRADHRRLRSLQGQIGDLSNAVFELGQRAGGLSQTQAKTEDEARSIVRAIATAQAEQTRLKAEIGSLRQTLLDLQRIQREREKSDPNFNPPEHQTFADLAALARRSQEPVVYLYPTDDGAFWQVIHGGQASPEDQGMVASLPILRMSVLLLNDPADVNDTADEPGWLHAYANWLAAYASEAASPSKKDEAQARWLASMAHTLAVLGQELMTPVAHRLEALKAERCVLIPGGLLSFLPLHAAVLSDGQVFGDRFTVRYAPSAALLRRAEDRALAERPAQPRLVAIARIRPARLSCSPTPMAPMRRAGLGPPGVSRASGPRPRR